MSDDDALLNALADHARQRPPDPRLEALLAGELSATERADLRAEAAGDPALAAGLDLYTPLDAAALDRMTDHLLTHVIGAEDAADVDAADVDAADADADDAVPPAQGAAPAVDEAPAQNVIAFPSRRRIWLAAPLLAAAAAVVFFVTRPTVSPLPAYTAAVSGGDVLKRGYEAAPEGVRVLRAASRLEIALVPPTQHGQAFTVRAFIHDGSTFHPWSPPIEQAGSAARIVGTVADLGLAAHGLGPRTLVFQLVPQGESAPAPSLATDREDVRQVVVSVRLE